MKQIIGMRIQKIRVARELCVSFTWVSPWIVVVDVNWTHVKFKARLSGPLSFNGVFFAGPLAMAILFRSSFFAACKPTKAHNLNKLVNERKRTWRASRWMIYVHNYRLLLGEICEGWGWLSARFVLIQSVSQRVFSSVHEFFKHTRECLSGFRWFHF